MATEWEAAVGAAFATLGGTHWEKKKATILALVDARLAGRPEESVWRLPETCSRQVYHAKWKRDPSFAAALAAVDRLAREWKDGRAVRALQEAAERLALASPVAAATAVRLLGAEDPNIKLRAAFGILDRAGMETATKAAFDNDVTLRVVYDDGVSDSAAEAAPESG